MNDLQRLKEMGITVWDVRRPECYPDVSPQPVSLPDDCKLLLVCESKPTEQEALLFSKVLASMKLSVKQALHLPPQAVNLLDKHQLEWCWFAGTQQMDIDGVKMLTSPSLAVLENDQFAKKQLWQQIKQYES
ncbi:DNA polymerase III subunit psi [Grimontia kaedaensis]|uniref:DNA polymerase III subunit psi n=1 Tax=Grimontia kaedaensis TaxID=2872157 RepID=A0ABY4WTM7_9GAMM|nr:DNA polymerase III subunit psi [Grimontia kaedaensis]USH01954.1 DNA polymerase III subunit psi [Grimontia kaedaensis]